MDRFLAELRKGMVKAGGGLTEEQCKHWLLHYYTEFLKQWLFDDQNLLINS